ncbi:T-lymphocyte activation antigen CD86-like [Trichomycterus rosablanca]|uniref:T-lymphocyte activation antigen CD86-like n=1 Tax=Trichomycterus rosablanca TaxID=2290929 RepID=UPI002F355357
MASVTQLIFFSVLVSVTASSDVYKLVNSSVQLDTQDKNVQFDQFKWMFKSDNILRYLGESKFIKKLDAYKDRVEFNTETLSITLKNLQKNDSGLYEAKAESNKEKVVARYTLYVLDPVKEPELTSVFDRQSSISCNVICKSPTLSITSSCYMETCDEKEGTSPEGVSYTLSLCGDAITTTGGSVCLLKIMLYSVGLVLMVSAVITVHIRERFIKPKIEQHGE